MADASATTSPDASPAHPSRPGPIRRLFADRAATLRTLSTATSVLILGTVVATIVVGMPALQARASDIRLADRPVKVAFAWPPLAGQGVHRPPLGASKVTDKQTWVNAEIRRDVEHIALGLISSDPLDGASLAKARSALLGTGWFGDDLRLVRGNDNVVRVTGSWKVPAAAVRTNGMDQLISAKAELLPPRYPTDRSGMKLLIGVAGDAPMLGQPYTGPEVQAGLKLLDYVRSLPTSKQITGVDVSEFASTGSLSLVTDLGNTIVWGGAIDAFSPGQPPARVKLARLNDIALRHGRVDAGRAMIDLRMTDGVYIRDVDGLMTTAEAEAQASADDKGRR